MMKLKVTPENWTAAVKEACEKWVKGPRPLEYKIRMGDTLRKALRVLQVEVETDTKP